MQKGEVADHLGTPDYDYYTLLLVNCQELSVKKKSMKFLYNRDPLYFSMALLRKLSLLKLSEKNIMILQEFSTMSEGRKYLFYHCH